MDFPFPTENVMLWFFFSVKKHLEAHRGLGFGHTFCFSKWLKICLKMSHCFIRENETFLKDFPPLCAYLLIATMAKQRNRTKRFFWSLKTEALPESLSCGIWGFCQSFSIWLCASFCQSGSRHASWFFQRIFSYHFLQRKKPSLPPGFKHIVVNLTGNSTQVWPAIKSFKKFSACLRIFSLNARDILKLKRQKGKMEKPQKSHPSCSTIETEDFERRMTLEKFQVNFPQVKNFSQHSLTYWVFVACWRWKTWTFF